MSGGRNRTVTAQRANFSALSGMMVPDLPPLEYHQTKRLDHRLLLRRH
jgi:hypothetical protein